MARSALLLVMGSLGLGGGLSASGAFEPRVERVLLEEPANSNGFLFDVKPAPSTQWAADVDLPITASFVDERGGTTRRTPATARLRLITKRGTLVLSGEAERPVIGGRVSFAGLHLVGAGAFQLELIAGDSVLARTRTLFLNSRQPPDLVARVRILAGEVNGQSVDSVHPIIRVRPGEILRGEILMRVTSTTPTSAVLVGAIPFWGDRRSNFVALRAVPPHADTTYRLPMMDGTATRRLLRAPEQPGRYAMVIVQGTETEMRYIASATNWMFGTPKWSDGNDIVDMSPMQLEALRTKGRIDWTWVVPKPDTPMRSETRRTDLVGAVLDIEVLPAADR